MNCVGRLFVRSVAKTSAICLSSCLVAAIGHLLLALGTLVVTGSICFWYLGSYGLLVFLLEFS